MIHPHTRLQFINDDIGYGVFAAQHIPRGTIVYVKDPLELEFTPEAYAAHTQEMQAVIEKYSYIDERGVRILSWDFAKYVNHCCQFNTISTGYGFEIAVRDILPGEEITDDYALFNLEYDMSLVCSRPECRGLVSSRDFDRLVPEWDRIIQQTLPLLFDQAQPLLPFLDPETLKELEALSAGNGNYRSVSYLKRPAAAVPVNPSL